MDTCGKCSKQVKQTDTKLCTLCHGKFHYQCLGLSAETFAKESKSYKSTWKCMICKSDKGTTSSDVVDALKTYFNEKLEDAMKKLRGDIKHDIKSDSADTKSKITELTESVTFMSAKYEEIKELLESKIQIINSLEAENKGLRVHVKDLNARLVYFEQQSRECNLEIQCVPEHKSENLKTVVKQLAASVGCDLGTHDLLNYHRVAKVNRESSRPRSIIVKLPSPLKRDEVIAAVKNYNKSHSSDKLNSSHLGIAGDRCPVFVGEHLTPANKQLHAACRKIAKEKLYEFVWIRNGRIYMRKDVNSKSFVVKDMEMLHTLD